LKNRYGWVAWVGIVLLGPDMVAFGQGAFVRPAERGDKPNIVLILADDLGWNSVGYRGDWVQTPQIDRLAQRGVSLDRFYVSPMCSPTRAGLMTGRYPMRYGMARTVVRPWMRDGLPPEERTVAEALAEAGYRHRGVFGKWHLGSLDPKWHPLAQGFTQFEGLYLGAADYWTRKRMKEVDWHVNYTPSDKTGYTTDLITDAAVRFINQHAKNGPFFCYVPYTAVHDPLEAPESYIAQYADLEDESLKPKRRRQLRTLAAMTTCMDDGIGKILDALDANGITDNTLVWFISDNGGVRKFPIGNRPLRAGKLTVYEGGVRVPSVVWWPGRIEGGRKLDVPMINVDVLPTLLRVVGLDVASDDKPIDGVDLLDVLSGREESLPGRDLYFFTGMDGVEKEQIAIVSADGWKLVVIGPDVRRPEGFRTKEHQVELFHLDVDPCEKNDLAVSEPDRVATLGEKLVAFRRSEPAACMVPVNEPPEGFKPPRHWENKPRPQPAGAGRARAGEAPPRPNILFVLIDDMGYGDLSCYGSQRVQTPNIDRLAREGIRFTQFYINSPICSPSRVAFTTGQYPGRWRITSYLSTRRADRTRGLADWLLPSAPSLARYLAEAGYYTAHVGKWHMGGQRDVGDAPAIAEYGFATSLTNFEGLGERVLPRFEPSEDGKPFHHGPTRMSAALGGGPIHWVERHAVTAFYVDRTLREIRAAGAQKRPFYINLWLDDVHTPIQPPPDKRGDGSNAARYDGVMDEMDRQLGRVFDLIRSEPSLRGNTLILLASDNGPEDGWGSPGGLRGGKCRLYEGGIRSPLIAWYDAMPERAVGSVNEKTVLAAIDVPPSLLALCDIRPADDVRFDGLNMGDALVGRRAPERQEPIFWVRPPDRPGPDNSWPDLAIRDGDWKLLINRDGSQPELYNITDDPKESRNLADKHPALVQRLGDRVMAWERTVLANAATRPTCRADR
jgi:arylsulfatase A-like enzyme